MCRATQGVAGCPLCSPSGAPQIYFGQDGEALVVLLGGGDKNSQSGDIEKAKICWQDYREEKEHANA
jgi:putative addiction module killer protein